MVCLGDALDSVSDQQDHISFFERDLCLFTNVLNEISRSDRERGLAALFAGVNAAGVNDKKS